MSTVEISYITADIELDSREDLSLIVNELGKNASIQLNQWVDDIYRVSLSPSSSGSRGPAEAITKYCELLESLSDGSKALILRSERSVIDLAFEGGSEPISKTFQIPKKLTNRISKLGLGIAVTIYREGQYTH